ncbi:MAG: PaaI family thioesterase [Pirellulaceae bacterium]|nr:PaaI family thioesterase [Pirellulaceae bacterium]
MKRHSVTGKQPNSKMCLVCGLGNQFGLQTAFYEVDSNQLVAVFSPQQAHQGYPDRLHGGIAASILDETIGRAIRLQHGDELWGVTIELNTKFRAPIPLDQEIRVVGRVTKDRRRDFEGTGELLLQDGTVAAEARGRYLKMSVDRIADFDYEAQEWKVIPSDGDPAEFHFKER